MTLGIDIGGTTISLGLVSGAEVVKKVCVPSFAADATKDQTLRYLGGQIEEILTADVKKIGIGVPSLTDPVQGIVYDAANIPSWDVVPLKERLEKCFGLPVSVNNDANCYALGASIKAGPSEMLVAVTLGTGTGVGIVPQGKLICGPHCGAGEIGALPYGGQDYESFCSKKFFHAKGVSPKKVAEAAENGNHQAREMYREFGRHLGAFLSVVMFAYDPDCVVLGGGIARSYPLFRESMMRSLSEKYPYSKTLADLRILAMPEDEVALIGAASL